MFLYFYFYVLKLKDADIIPNGNEDPRPQRVEHGIPREPHSTSGSSMVHRDPSPVEICPSYEKALALVLYNPINTPLFGSPASPDFSIILNSDLNPGLKGKNRETHVLLSCVSSQIHRHLKLGLTNDSY